MKKLLTILFSSILYCGGGWAQCPDYSVLLLTQQDIDYFAATYPNCTEIVGGLYIGDIELTFSEIYDLSPLNQITSIGGDLWIFYTFLTDLNGLNNLTSIGGGEFGGGLWISYNHSLTSLNGLNNLNSIGGNIGIDNNDDLIDLSALNNINPNTIGGIDINYNWQLSACDISSICEYLKTGGQANIHNNAFGCNTVDEVLTSCDVSRLEVQTFYDINQNKIQDAGEPYYADAVVTLTPGDIFLFHSPSTYYLLPGNYTVTYNVADNEGWLLTTDSTSYFLSIGMGEKVTRTFGVYPPQFVSELKSFTSLPHALCNRNVIFNISTQNTATTTASGTMWLQMDDDVTQTAFITPPDEITNTSPVYYGWYFTDLYPSETFTVPVRFGIPGPPDFPIGNFLNLSSFTDYTDTNGLHTSETFNYNTEVRCSFDPNDKLVNPAREGNYVLFDEDLIYNVRFQNTGNDVAYDVVILDTLDANLDRETFRLLGSSHAERLNTRMSADGILTFEFKDIFLPDSTSNFEGSEGYVSYLIRAIDGLAEGTPITNSAGIYFDLNPPVITNTVRSIMVSDLPLPVEMTDPLSVRLDNQTAVLKWRTVTETNSVGFEVQRSKDGTQWERIGWQAGQGDTSTPHAYTYTDKNPLSGTSYYRLKQVDFDGNFTYSNIADLYYERDAPISVYPNPVRDILYINTEHSINQTLIFDTTGKSINAQMTNNSIDVSTFPKGIYTLKMTIGDSVSYQKILIK